MLRDDGDVIKGLGFVTLYSAWVEEDVDDILRLFSEVVPFDNRKQRLPISRKLKHAANPDGYPARHTPGSWLR